MPSGWMPDARHDTRTAFLFASRPDPRHHAQRTSAGERASTRRTTHRHSHRPRAIAHG